MAAFDGSSPALVEHMRAAVKIYLKSIETDISAAYDLLEEAKDLGEDKVDHEKLIKNINELVFKLDEARTAFARLPFTINVRADYL